MFRQPYFTKAGLTTAVHLWYSLHETPHIIHSAHNDPLETAVPTDTREVLTRTCPTSIGAESSAAVVPSASSLRRCPWSPTSVPAPYRGAAGTDTQFPRGSPCGEFPNRAMSRSNCGRPHRSPKTNRPSPEWAGFTTLSPESPRHGCHSTSTGRRPPCSVCDASRIGEPRTRAGTRKPHFSAN